jgi:gliding motility-associated-like protein
LGKRKNSMNAEEFREIINGMKEAPSADCWNAIQQQLAATVAGGSAAVSASKVAAQTAGKVASVAGKGALSVAKVAAISGATIAVATVAVVVAINLTAPQDAAVPAAPTAVPAIVLTADTMSMTDTAKNSVIAPETANPQTISYGNAIVNSNNNPSSTSTTTSSNNAVPMATTVPSTDVMPVTTVPAAPAPLAAAAASPASTAAKENTAITKPADDKPAIKQTVTAPEQDPVASLYHQEDNPDYRPPVRIEIPNTITPNGDGYNDFFIIAGLEQCEEYQLIIFNRARKEIFRTKNYQNNWDASHQEGSTFYYTLIYKVNNIHEKRTGTIYVLR